MPIVPRLLTFLTVAALAAACTADQPSGRDHGTAAGPAAATTTTAAPARRPAHAGGATAAEAPAWRVGARPLPLRPDGFGKVLPTPAPLRDRRFPTVDRLPPPGDGRFHSSIEPVSAAVRARMGTAWSAGCPVPLADLRHLTVSFRGFDGRAHTGELVVNQRVAGQVVGVFAKLYRARFPIEEMRLVTGADLHAHPSGDGNNTAAFVCRTARKQARWSAHAYGLAVDVDPFQNPYQRGDLVLPELASAYLDRGRVRPGMIRPGDVVTKAFAAIGWTWGATWGSPVDRMHFSATGD
ncbi:MAG TPA: M15 family metallopeptidase [Actinomycetes bacterium]